MTLPVSVIIYLYFNKLEIKLIYGKILVHLHMYWIGLKMEYLLNHVHK
jgi:hypothetical protein